MTGLVTKANTIAIPTGFNPRDPASIAAAFAALPNNGRDIYAVGQSGGAGIIGPALEIERLEISTGPSLLVVETLYALTLPAESFSLATGGVVEVTDSSSEGGGGSDELVVYYGETAPLSTMSGAVITGSGVYNTIDIDGVGALSIPFNTNFDDTSWTVDISETALAITDAFTFELFGRLGATLPANDFQSSYYEVFLYDENANLVFGVSFLFDEPNGGGFTGSPVILELTIQDADDFIQQPIAAGDAAAMRHFSVQLIGGNRVVAHYNGAVVFDEERTYSAPASLQLYIYSFKVDDPALGQMRLSNSALYGADAFTPPSPVFFDDSE